MSSIFNNDGETVDVVDGNSGGEETTTALPNFVEHGKFTANQLEILDRWAVNDYNTYSDLADDMGKYVSAVSETLKKFREKYNDELKERGIYEEFVSNHNSTTKHQNREDETREKIYQYFMDDPDKSMADCRRDLDVEAFSDAQIRGYKGNAARERKAKQTKTTETMNDIDKLEDRINNLEESLNAHKDLQNARWEDMDDRTQENFDTLSGSIDTLEGKVSYLADSTDDNHQQIQQLSDKLTQLKGMVDDLRQEPEETQDQKRYVGENDKIVLQLSEFEAMFIANRLWDAGEMLSDVNNGNIGEEAKWWARKIHGERNTRD